MFPNVSEYFAKVKQADVILLGYPLMMNMLRSTRMNDLRYYEVTKHIRF